MPKVFNPALKVHWGTHLQALLEALGYDYDKAGVCFGIASIAAIAHLSNKMSAFEDTLAEMSYLDPQNIKAIINEGRLTQEVVDVLSLLDNVAMYQDTTRFKHLFPPETPFSNQLSGLYSANELLKRMNDNSIARVNAICGSYGNFGLAGTLFNLQQSCQKLEASKTPVSFFISYIGHTISCHYDPANSEWKVVDLAGSKPDEPVLHTNDLTKLTDFIWTNMLSIVNSKRICLIDIQTVCNKDDEKLVAETLEKWEASENKYNSSHNTLSKASEDLLLAELTLSIWSRNREMVEAILELDRVDLSKHYPGQFTPLITAVLYGYKDIVSLLLEYGADPNIRSDTGQTLWEIALGHDRIDIIDLLLDDNIIDKDFRGLYIDTKLIIFVAKHGRIDIAQKLLATNLIEINKQIVFGESALHVAAEAGQLEFVKFLLLHPNIDPNLPDAYNNTAFNIAKMLADNAIDANTVRRYRAIAQAISMHPKFDATKHEQGDSILLHYYVKRNNNKAIDEMLWKRNFQTLERDKKGHSVFYYAVKKNNIGLMLKLLKYLKITHDDLLEVQHDGKNLLHSMAAMSNLEGLEIIIKKMNDENLPLYKTDQQGKSAILYAIESGSVASVKILLENIKNIKPIYLYLSQTLEILKNSQWTDCHNPLKIARILIQAIPNFKKDYHEKGKDFFREQPYRALAPVKSTLDTLMAMDKNNIVHTPVIDKSIGNSLLHEAIIANNSMLFEILLKNEDIQEDIQKFTLPGNLPNFERALDIALRYKRFDMAQRLLSAGASLQELYAEVSPRISAANHEILEEMMRSLKNGSLLYDKANDGKTFLTHAENLDMQYNTQLKSFIINGMKKELKIDEDEDEDDDNIPPILAPPRIT